MGKCPRMWRRGGQEQRSGNLLCLSSLLGISRQSVNIVKIYRILKKTLWHQRENNTQKGQKVKVEPKSFVNISCRHTKKHKGSSLSPELHTHVFNCILDIHIFMSHQTPQKQNMITIEDVTGSINILYSPSWLMGSPSKYFVIQVRNIEFLPESFLFFIMPSLFQLPPCLQIQGYVFKKFKYLLCLLHSLCHCLHLSSPCLLSGLLQLSPK